MIRDDLGSIIFIEIAILSRSLTDLFDISLRHCDQVRTYKGVCRAKYRSPVDPSTSAINLVRRLRIAMENNINLSLLSKCDRIRAPYIFACFNLPKLRALVDFAIP